MPLSRFHPLVARWFEGRFAGPTPPQEAGWEHIASGRDTLIAAPTGSGKTLAAFMWSIDELVRAGGSDDHTAVVYVSPLKALGNDIQHNLQEPLAEMREMDPVLPEIRVAVRSGDTPARERELMVRTPPHILITTPESFYIMLTAERPRNFLRTARAVIVDEIHAVAGDKRGSHLALSLERLDALAGRRLQRIGLSATQKPIEEIARLLVGAGREAPAIVDVGHRRDWELRVEVPSQPLGPIASHELRAEIYDRIASLSKEHRTTLVFVNTRRLVERLAHQLTERLGEGKVAAHHGSLSRAIRLQAERGLKSGEVPVVVATASLELGIDIGHVDLVCHLGAPRSLATMLQRIGRSGHWLGGISKGILFPLTRDELVQCAAAVRAARAGELDRVELFSKPLDILAQQMVATVATGEIGEDELWSLVRRAHPYRDLERAEFDQVLEMLAEGVAGRHGRRSAFVHRDEVHGMLRPRRGARLAAITSGGAIPDTADYSVVEDPEGTFVGTVNEDFAIESMAGDIFLLGNTSWRIRRVESATVRVEDAHGAPPTIPFWLGEAPARTRELSEAVSALRSDVAGGMSAEGLVRECGIDDAGAEQIVQYVGETVAVLGCVPTTQNVVAERFFDEGGGMQLVVHAPFGARINRAWGLALRKRFCVSFDFELQAAATDDGLVLSLGEQHSFPLDSVFAFVRSGILEETLVQAALQSPMFATRFRWNAQRSLALLRHTGGRRVPFPIFRMRAEDLLGAVFPEQVACQDNAPGGPITPPDHPLVNETIRNCLHEVMDLDGLREIVGAIERGELRAVAVETPEPSQMSHEILNANPYAFLDDAPLEERRARAVALRRMDPELARGVGALDPDAIEEVRAQARPDIRTPDELHDHLLSVVLLPVGESSWDELAAGLIEAGRVTVATKEDGLRAYVASERLSSARLMWPGARLDPEIRDVSRPVDSREEAVRQAVHGWVQCTGPFTASELGAIMGLSSSDVEIALGALEASGVVLRGRYTPEALGQEWCERRLLARIHRLTVGRLRKEIEAVSAADFMRFLFRWQHVHLGSQLHGRDGVAQIVGKLQGLELPAPAWEAHVLPARVARYEPADLDYLCLSGTVAWGRLAPGGSGGEPPVHGGPTRPGLSGGPPDQTGGSGGERAERADPLSEPAEDEDEAPQRRPGAPARNTPLGFLLRDDLPHLATPRDLDREIGSLSAAAQDVARFLEREGASFHGEVAKGTGRMPSEVEDALWELVSTGLVTGDGVAGLRALLGSTARHQRRQHRLRAVHGVRPRPLPSGRWSLWRAGSSVSAQERNEAVARQLLRRYGVVFRELLARERHAPSWRVLVGILRRLEWSGEIRGGRFVAGFVGEQFALAEAVEALRAVRRTEDTEVLVVSAADPVNLAGIVLPGARISPLSGHAVAFKGGVVVDSGPLGTLRSRLRVTGDLPALLTSP